MSSSLRGRSDCRFPYIVSAMASGLAKQQVTRREPQPG
jgi:hypothetical protein